MTAPRVPTAHTAEGGVLVGSPDARRLVVYEDLQCPFCARFEEACADLLAREVEQGDLAVEYRVRAFLGEESVRAASALALAAEAGRFDELRRELFASQPREHSGGFAADDLVAAGERVGLTDDDFVQGVREGRYEEWARAVDDDLQQQDPDGTPWAVLDGRELEQGVLYDAAALEAELRR